MNNILFNKNFQTLLSNLVSLENGRRFYGNFPQDCGPFESLVKSDCEVLASQICAQAQINTLLGLVRNLDNMSFGDQKRFWITMNALSRTKLIQAFDVNLRKIFYNGSKHEFNTLVRNYKKHSKEMDFSKREVIELLLDKYEKKVRAQALLNFGLDFSHLDNMCTNGSLSDMVKNLKISHEINIPVVDKISNILQQISSSSLKRSLIILIVFLIKCKKESVDVYDVIMLLTSLGVVDVISCSLMDLARYVLNSFQRTDVCVYAQGSVDDIFIENIFATVVHFVKNLILPNEGGSKDFSIRSKKIFEIWRAVKSVDEMIRALLSFVEIAQEKIVKYMCGYSLRDQKLFSKLPGLEKWYNDVNEMYLEEGNFDVTISPHKANEAKQLYNMGLEYFKTLRAIKCPQEVLAVFHNALGMAKELFLHAQSLNCTSKTRVPPLVVHFHGGAGLGKSTLCQYVIGDVAKEAGFTNYSNDLIYIRDVQQEFWDGYSGQFATIYDDIFQSDDALKRGLEAVELVRANNTMQMPLHMADISQKGNMCFSSKLILLTSNPPRERCIGISTNDAFWRRRDFVFKIVPNEKYCRRIEQGSIVKMRVDPMKVREITGQMFSTDIYLFDMEDVETGEILRMGLSYDEMIGIVKSGYSAKYANSCDLLKAVEERFYAQGFIRNIVNRVVRKDDIFYDCVEHARTFATMGGSKLFSWINSLRDIEIRYPILKWISVGVSLFGIFSSLWNLLFNSKDVPRGEYNISGDMQTSKRHVRTIVKGEYNISGDSKTSRHNVKTRVKSEGCADPNAFALVNNRLWKNCVRVIVSGSSGEIIMRGLFVKGKLMIVPNHLLKFNDVNLFISLETAYGKFSNIPFSDLTVESNDEIDLCMILFPKYVADFADITKHFINSSDVGSMNISQALMYKYEGKHSSQGVVHRLDRVNKIGKQRYELDTNNGSIPCMILQGLRYETFTEPGMCGSPLIAMNPSCTRKILGFHVAGSTHYGYSNLITSLLLNKLIDCFELQVVPEEPELLEVDGSKSKLLAEGNVNIIGKVPGNMRIFYPNKTKIRPSLMYGKLTSPVTAPAILDRKGLVDPLIKGIMKYMDDPIKLSDNTLEQCVATLRNDIFPLYVLPHRKKILTIFEAMNGVDGDKYITSMNWNTSVGYPYVKMNLEGTGKYKLIKEVYENKYMPGDILMEDIRNRTTKAKLGIAVPTIWVDNLKDERRAIDKVMNSKTRVFVTGPFDFTVVFRQYCLGFTAHIMDNRHNLECAVGVNPHSYEWSEIYNKLDVLGNDDTWIAGDFSAYDGILPTQIIEGICRIINNWYDDGEENKTIRRVLFSSIYNSYHICDDLIYRTNHGNPSGNPFTAVMNSLANTLLMRYVYLQLGSKLGYDLSTYNMFVKAVNYGDDNLLHVHESCKWFNMIDISKEFASLGITYTSASKDGVERRYVHRKDITFLKRKFIWLPKIDAYMAPLEWDSIMEMLNWVREGQHPKDALLANIRSALYELYHYGPDVYKEYKDKVDAILLLEGIRPFDDTWYYYYGLWSSGVEDVNCDHLPYYM